MPESNMDLILKGILTGLVLSVLVGATFFMLIETSMTRGFRAALWFAAGVLTCDALIIASVYFFTTWINATLVQNSYFNVTGGLVFMGFGINYLLSRQRKDTLMLAKSRNIRLFMNGFFINLLNPSVLIFWLGTMAITISQLKMTGRETLVFFASALAMVGITDILKSYFAYKLSFLLNPRILRLIYIFSGFLMIGLGLYFILR
jgi:threonine/homoserine/homoserine lactone efflux protein